MSLKSNVLALAVQQMQDVEACAVLTILPAHSHNAQGKDLLDLLMVLVFVLRILEQKLPLSANKLLLGDSALLLAVLCLHALLDCIVLDMLGNMLPKNCLVFRSEIISAFSAGLMMMPSGLD